MESFIISFFVVATAEIGDKTQLLALCLASRFRKPMPIILGIFAATLANHLASGWVGQWVGSLLSDILLHFLLALSFFGAAVWAFIPDTLDEAACLTASHKSIFATTFVTFFIAEMGDKTQLATVALAAQFQSLLAVVTGTTLGMMAVNIPAVLLSHFAMREVSLKLIRLISGLLFAMLGIYELCKCWYG